MLKFKDLMERINETRSLNLEEVEGLDELSTDALRKYRAKAKDDAYDAADVDDDRRLRKRSMGSWDAGKKILKRGDKLRAEEVEQIDELSKATMGSYIKKAIPDAEHKEYWGRADRPTKGQRQYLKSAKNRRRGINKAIDKLTKEDAEQTDEALKGNQHKIDANKNGKVDGHDFKILRNAKKARYQ